MFQKSTHIYINNEPIDVMKFSGGEVQVRVPDVSGSVSMTAFLNNSDAIMEMLLAYNALTVKPKEICIPYFPYARQDRICAEGEAFSLGVMAKMLIYGLDDKTKIQVFDPHSKTVEYFLRGSTDFLIPSDLFQLLEYSPKKNIDYVVSPDKGALDRVRMFAIRNSLREICATKERDPVTGNITSTKIDMPSDGNHFLIVDDICDGGRTFIELAKAMRVQASRSITINLWVTHGIFSQGFDVFKGHIDNIYYSNSRNQDGTGNPYNIHHKEIT